MSGKYFLNEMGKPDVSQRMAQDMKPVLFEPSNLKIDNKEVFYTVYRNLGVIPELARYDITVIPARPAGGPARKVGREFSKTFGHYHRGPQSDLYEVLEGHAYFLIQRYEHDPGEIKEVYIIEASAGEKAVTPPNFGHLAINVGDTDLVLANWVGFVEYDYETYKKFRGGCYYVLDTRLDSARQAGENIEFEKNKNYKSAPEIKKLKQRDIPE
ncbi:MAG: glucose-6-phosphate isomerase family protein, partial [Candidatus Giovannonibacteria bacterium]|nr:glucose-6-phosphate isomerase family protein [Candidatus Giovannonibacteria bacterium]